MKRSYAKDSPLVPSQEGFHRFNAHGPGVGAPDPHDLAANL